MFLRSCLLGPEASARLRHVGPIEMMYNISCSGSRILAGFTPSPIKKYSAFFTCFHLISDPVIKNKFRFIGRWLFFGARQFWKQ
jgi:hypothetical protein